MSETDQCQQCGRYLYTARERATAEERDALRAEVERLTTADAFSQKELRRGYEIIDALRAEVEALLKALELCGKMINKRVKVEEELWLVAAGKAEIPDKDKCRDWAQRLGIPDEYLETITKSMESA